MLEQTWVREHTPGDGTFYILSGFANYNGGVRFYPVFKNHVEKGGHLVAFLGGSTAQNLTSQQVVEELLGCGAEVNIVNRKRILHAKCYGVRDSIGQKLVVSSGNFTGPGMSQNVEAALALDRDSTATMRFSWDDLVSGIRRQRWEIYQPTLADRKAPAWKLLYDEIGGPVTLDTSQEATLVVTLGHHDTARIQAGPGSEEGKGSQYIWLSRDCYDFFPPLTIRNTRGVKATFSAIIKVRYVDLGVEDDEVRVTFEAENNLDFRFGTGKLRYTRLADEGDLAAISRIGEAEYELRIIRQGSPQFAALSAYAINFIGHQGKRFGYLPNHEFEKIMGVQLGKGSGFVKTTAGV